MKFSTENWLLLRSLYVDGINTKSCLYLSGFYCNAWAVWVCFV